MHGVKSITQRTRECMRNQRSERRVNEVFQIIQDDEDEVPPSDISITLDEAMGDPDVTEFECSMKSSVSDFSNDSSSNSSEHGSCDEGTLDTGSLYDEINDRMLCYDLNNQTKPYPSCPLSIRDACLAIVKVARRLNLDKNGTKHLLDCIRSLSPIDAKLPRTISALMEVIGFDCSKQVIYYCRECLCRLHAPDQTECLNGCSLNGKRRPFMNASELVINDVKDEIRTTAQRYLNLINEYADCAHRVLPSDVPNGSINQRLRRSGERQLSIMLHTDGAPVTTIGGKSLWPIQATIVEIPPPVRDHASAVMVFAAWLGGTHPDRDLLWAEVVHQLQQLSSDGITLRSNDGSKLKFNVRVQLVTFDLPAMAQNCNVVQFNGYDACPYCQQHGYAIGTQIFYPYAQIPPSRKTDEDYLRGSTSNLPRSRSMGIKGPTPLTKIMLFPTQIAIDYMHLTCSGHFKTLINYWSNLLLPNVFDQASNYLSSCILPHSFGYQFAPLIHFVNWKTKMFRDFLLYISPIFVVVFLPDRLALHFLHYFIYIRVLHFHQNKDELLDVNQFFDHYYEHLAENYGPKSELCTIHIHSHLLAQVKRHGCLAMTSCFPRESFIGHAVKWCHGKKYMLEQFFTWYRIDRALCTENTMSVSYLFDSERFDEKYLNQSTIESSKDEFISCCTKKNLQLDGARPVKIFARYFRGLKTFHSLSYGRSGNAISYWVSTTNDKCPGEHGRCFAEVIFYFLLDDEYYGFLRHYKCLDKSLSDGLSSAAVPPELARRLNTYYHFFSDRKFTYKIVPIRSILNKVIRMPWTESNTSVFTEVHLDWEHD